MRRRRSGQFTPSALDRFVGASGVGHVDMMEVLAADGLRWPSLDDACAAFDIPHVPHGVISAVPAPQRKSETDVLATFLLYLVDRAAQQHSSHCLLPVGPHLPSGVLKAPIWPTGDSSRPPIRRARRSGQCERNDRTLTWTPHWCARRRWALADWQKIGLKGAVEPVLVNLGANIRFLRERHGWTQDELARAINTSRISVGRLERGQQNPTILLLSHIASALEVDLKDLVDYCRQ